MCVLLEIFCDCVTLFFALSPSPKLASETQWPFPSLKSFFFFSIDSSSCRESSSCTWSPGLPSCSMSPRSQRGISQVSAAPLHTVCVRVGLHTLHRAAHCQAHSQYQVHNQPMDSMSSLSFSWLFAVSLKALKLYIWNSCFIKSL